MGSGVRAGASQERAHAGCELARQEWLDDVVVRADFQGEDAVGLFGSATEDQYGQVAEPSDFAQDVQPAQPGEPEVEDEDIGRLLTDGAEGLGPARRVPVLEAVGLECPSHEQPHRPVVVDDEHPSLLWESAGRSPLLAAASGHVSFVVPCAASAMNAATS